MKFKRNHCQQEFKYKFILKIWKKLIYDFGFIERRRENFFCLSIFKGWELSCSKKIVEQLRLQIFTHRSNEAKTCILAYLQIKEIWINLFIERNNLVKYFCIVQTKYFIQQSHSSVQDIQFFMLKFDSLESYICRNNCSY